MLLLLMLYGTSLEISISYQTKNGKKYLEAHLRLDTQIYRACVSKWPSFLRPSESPETSFLLGKWQDIYTGKKAEEEMGMVGGTAACKESIRELGHQWRTCECRRVYGHREGNLKSSTELASPLAAGVSIVGPGAGPPQSQREQPPLAKKEEEELTGSGSVSFSFHQGKKAQELTLTVGK